MNKASRGFGLTSVVIAVIILAVSAVFSSSAESVEMNNINPTSNQQIS